MSKQKGTVVHIPASQKYGVIVRIDGESAFVRTFVGLTWYDLRNLDVCTDPEIVALLTRE